MHCFEMQDWVTIRGATYVATLSQSEPAWVDLAGYRDVVVWTEVKEMSTTSGATLVLSLQTAPTQDETLFTETVAAFSATPGVTATVIHRDTAGVPIARWLRWQLGGQGSITSTSDITFRMWIAAAGKGAQR